ncbi:hypothetical protein FGL72_04490 [Leuconostoc citreum]|uniref:hypothetical protein n=1 Tax=Leuconostoc citreum TaxID=33964 RepID=UPI0011BBA1E7|nr:hypothetical protein [Leuconostoc citreum]QEA46411.1 hypothetical protein FGL82_08555 [Leuconostoc citreum]QEA63101.1 hypothetical protein FGL72_04490 [Leuconostoc citreum]
MTQTKELYGYITAITKSPEVIILSFQEKNATSVIALTLATPHYLEVFPAGDPELGVAMIAVFEESGTNIQVKSIYNPAGDFIAVDEVGDFELMADAMTTPKDIDLYEKLRQERQAMLAAIDLSPEEISELTLAHEQEKEQMIETPDYGNLVTGEGGQYE